LNIPAWAYCVQIRTTVREVSMLAASAESDGELDALASPPRRRRDGRVLPKRERPSRRALDGETVRGLVLEADDLGTGTAMLTFAAGALRSNHLVLPLGTAGDLDVLCAIPSGTAHLVIDVMGYSQ